MSNGMKIVTQKCCVRRAPIVLTVTLNDIDYPLLINGEFLNVCKHRIMPGHSAELYDDRHFLVTFTRISEREKFVNIQQREAGTLLPVQSLHVHANNFQITKHDTNVHVFGLEYMAQSIIQKEFYIPSINLQKLTCMPRVSSSGQALDAIKAMQLSVADKSVQKNLILAKLYKQNIISKAADKEVDKVADKVADKTGNVEDIDNIRTGLQLRTARKMLWFNNKTVSRIRSLYKHLPVDFARNVCLNAALAHAATHPKSTIFIAHTFQHVPVAQNVISAMQDMHKQAMADFKACQEFKAQQQSKLCASQDSLPEARKTLQYKTKGMVVKYLNARQEKCSLYLLPLTTAHKNMLCENNIDIHGHVAYLGLGLDSTPILIANITLPKNTTCNSILQSIPECPKTTAMQDDLRRRLLLNAICASHFRLHMALPALLRSATYNKHAFPSTSSPALDIWALHMLENA